MTTMANDDDGNLDALSSYKTLLRELIDRRPSGTRQRLAEAMGTHKSFISQVINHKHRVPLPAQHIPALFRTCHFTEQEQRLFLDLYRQAHPTQATGLDDFTDVERNVLRIHLPDFDDGETAAEVETTIREVADRIIRLAWARKRRD